jgi:hypothetical protein
MPHSERRAHRNRTTLRYIPCRVEPGMFKDEWLVHVDALNPRNTEQTVPIQLFADARDVAGIRGSPRRNVPAEAWLVVSFAGQRKGLAEIVLPQPSQPLGETVAIPAGAVRMEPGP